MNVTPENPVNGGSGADPGFITNETLRLLAHAPVPDGLAERIHAAIETRPQHSRILEWPVALEPARAWGGSQWMRAAAAAAIVFVVAGGGLGVFLHVQRPAARMVVAPIVQPAAVGGFSSAGAMRTPEAVKGPVVSGPVVSQPAKSASAEAAHKKAVHHAAASSAVEPAAATSTTPAGK